MSNFVIKYADDKFLATYYKKKDIICLNLDDYDWFTKQMEFAVNGSVKLVKNNDIGLLMLSKEECSHLFEKTQRHNNQVLMNQPIQKLKKMYGMVLKGALSDITMDTIYSEVVCSAASSLYNKRDSFIQGR